MIPAFVYDLAISQNNLTKSLPTVAARDARDRKGPPMKLAVQMPCSSLRGFTTRHKSSAGIKYRYFFGYVMSVFWLWGLDHQNFVISENVVIRELVSFAA